MDFTQPDPGQQQTDDVSGRDNVEPETSHEPERSHESATPHEPEGPTPAWLAPNSHDPGSDEQSCGRAQRFADVLAEVDAADERPLAEHNDVFSRAHRELTDALNDVERGDS